MKYVVAALLVAHGIAHLPGFAVPWRLMSSPEMPYTTTILSGRWDVGPVGIRVVGIAWLLAAMVFVTAGVAYARSSLFAVPLIAFITVASLLLCVLNWPQARIGLFVNVAVLVMLPLIGEWAWQAGSAARVRSLSAVADQRTAAIVDRTRLATVPAIVARFLSRALTDGQPLVATARVEQTGDFRVGDAWYPFRASQRFTVQPAGFVWDARIQMLPVMPVLVRDSYVAGSGSMRGEVLGIYPMVNQSGRRELDAGALQRYLAEAVWFPTALLPRDNLRWDALDDHRARATLTDRQTSVSLEFRFNDAGDVMEVFAPDRYAETHGHYEPKPWLVRCSEYEVHDGMRIPVQCEVAWVEANGPAPYWRGRITQVHYNE